MYCNTSEKYGTFNRKHRVQEVGFAYRVPIGDYNYLQWTNYSCPHNFEAYFLCYRWSDLWSKFRLIHNRAQYSCSLNSQPFLPVNANDTQNSENDRSHIFDIRPKPEFSFKKIRPSAEGISRSRRYNFALGTPTTALIVKWSASNIIS